VEWFRRISAGPRGAYVYDGSLYTQLSLAQLSVLVSV
jgi:hypothetical protein